MGNLKDWQDEQDASGESHKFGNLSVITNRVKPQTGASYTIPGIVQKDKAGTVSLRQFKGKQLTGNPDDRMHVIAVLEATDRNGQTYQDVRDDLSFSDSMKVFKNSLVDTFGPAFADVFAQRGKIPVEIALAPDGGSYVNNAGKTVQTTTFKVLKQFASDADRIAAEKEYFKRFATSSNGTNGSGIPADVETMARGLWDAVKNKETFLNLAKGDPKFAPYADALAVKFEVAPAF